LPFLPLLNPFYHFVFDFAKWHQSTTAMHSISTMTSSGKRATSTVERAGL
jgi:hypothetical protein